MHHSLVSPNHALRFILARAVKMLSVVLLLPLSALGQAQFTYTNNYGIWDCTTNNGATAITGYSGSGGDVTIPDRIPASTNDLPVTDIENSAFDWCAGVTSVTICANVTSIGDSAFANCPAFLWDPLLQYGYTTTNGATTLMRYKGPGGAVSIPSAINGLPVTSLGNDVFYSCSSITSVTIPNSVTNIGNNAFDGCGSLTGIAIPDNVSSIGSAAFRGCTNLTSITFPTNVTSIGDLAFEGCSSLAGLYFTCNAPSVGDNVFFYDSPTVYYLPGTTGWGPWFGGVRTVLWTPEAQTGGAGFGVRSNQFGFDINWARGMSVAVDACTNLANSSWIPLATNILTDSAVHFGDPQWTNYPSRFYRLRWP